MMNHKKTYYSLTHMTSKGKIVIEGPVIFYDLNKYIFSHDLSTFRSAQKQYQMLLTMSQTTTGRVIIARANDQIIGYVTFGSPDPLERWSTFNMPQILMLGGIEVSPRYRHLKIASHLLTTSMMDQNVENYIIISTEYYWHWDLQGTQLNVWEYREVMEKVMAAGGFKRMSTDDQEILSHPANCLMVRIGKNVNKETIERFNQLRFLRTDKLKITHQP